MDAIQEEGRETDCTDRLYNRKVERQTVRTGCTTGKYRDRLCGQAVQQESRQTDCTDRLCNRKVERQTVRTGCATGK